MTGFFIVIQRERKRPKDLNHSRSAIIIIRNVITPAHSSDVVLLAVYLYVLLPNLSFIQDITRDYARNYSLRSRFFASL